MGTVPLPLKCVAVRKVNSIFGALGLKLLEPKENPLSQDDFIRSLP
jgi:hypothetical protein